MTVETARECFLDLMSRAHWTENVDADITPTGSYINKTTHTLSVTDRDLALLADALGIDCKIYETTQASIRRHIAAAMAEAAE
jgi:hypothetical protein